MIRRFHGSTAAQIQVKNILKSVGSAWSKAPAQATSPQVIQALQTLRESLGSQQNVRSSVLELLDRVSAQSQNQKQPQQMYQLLEKSLGSNQLEVPDLVKMYQTVIRDDPKGDLTSKLFIKLHKSSKIDASTHAQNSLLYFEWLVKHKSPAQAVKFLEGVQKHFALENAQVVRVVELLNTPKGVKHLGPVFAASQQLDPATIEAAILNVCDAKDAEALASLTAELLASPLPRRTMIVLLDAHLTLDLNGKRVLVLMPKPELEDTLEYLELLLMATMQFGLEKTAGVHLVEQIKTRTPVKETTDLLLQWQVYSSQDIENIVESASTYDVDGATLGGLLKVADIARRSESDIAAMRSAFEDLGVKTNAAGYSILIRRALAGVEVEKARKLFIESVEQGAEWDQDNELYAPILSQLLCELCRSTHLDSTVKFDTYQRIRMVVSGIDYEAQLEMLKMFLERENTSDLATFLIEQWGEAPNLPYDTHKEMYTAFFDQILASGDYKMAWELYRIFNTTINLPYESYYPIQQKFCSLGRPDAAHLMFRHLRNRAKKEGVPPPARSMYLMLFVEYGRWMYEEGMTELEAYLRMDLNTELDIDLMNSMLIGYSALSDSPKVRDLWYETNGFAPGKGFNNLTATALLKHLAPMSLEAVDDLWSEIPSRYRIKPNEDNLCQYIIANCYHGYYSRALEIVQEAPALYGVPTSPKIISTLYNWTLLAGRKEKVRNWALEAFPEEWAALESSNQLQQVLVENLDGDSDDHARYEAIRALKNQTGGPLLRALHKTTDVD